MARRVYYARLAMPLVRRHENGRDTLVHLVGTPHPNPAKAEEFQHVDLTSIRGSVAAAKRRGLPHLVYVSVAHPAPAMHAYVAARVAGGAAVESPPPAGTQRIVEVPEIRRARPE